MGRRRGVALGLAVLALGILGILLPALPGTPFVLLSIGLLQRYSPRTRLLMRKLPQRLHRVSPRWGALLARALARPKRRLARLGTADGD